MNNIWWGQITTAPEKHQFCFKSKYKNTFKMVISEFAASLMTTGLGAIIGSTLGVYLYSYISIKAKNIATKEDIGEITKIVEAVKNKLGKDNIEFQIRLEKYHVRKLQVIEELLEKLQKLLFVIHDNTLISENNRDPLRWFKLSEPIRLELNAFNKFFLSKKIFIAEKTCSFLIDELNLLLENVQIFNLALSNLQGKGDMSAENMSTYNKSLTGITEGISKIALQIEADFRKDISYKNE